MYEHDEVRAATLEYFNGDELATGIWIDKYALRDNENNILEKTPRDMHRRIAKEFARVESKKYAHNNKMKPMSEDEIFNLLDEFKHILCQGSPMFGIGNPYQYVSLSNCFVLNSPQDTYASIMNTDKELVEISKHRGGVGIDLSNPRPKGSPTRNAAKSSTGTPAWMERYSNSIREVGQAGRRGALMQTISVHHPDILDFVTIKNDDTKVTGANISVRLTDEFLTAVENNIDYELRWPVDSKSPTISKIISANEVWKTIIHSAWLRAEPGLLFWDNIIRESPADCYEKHGYKTICTNPCILPRMRILTKNRGRKKITDLKIGEFIWSETGWTKVLRKWSMGVKDVYAYRTESSELFCTKDHEVLSNGKKVLAGHAESIDILSYTKCDNKIELAKTYRNEKVINSFLYSTEEVFDITVDNETHTFWCEGFNVSNCAELPLSLHDSCRLIALNLFGFVKSPFSKTPIFLFKKFYDFVKLAQRLMDDLIDLELESIDRIIDKIKADNDPNQDFEINLWNSIKKYCFNGRRTGLGLLALGDALAALNIKYDSPEGKQMAQNIALVLKLASYESSTEMAEAIGPFPVWDWELEKNNPFIGRIANEVFKDDDFIIDGSLIFERIRKFGRRQIANLTIAPTGSISCLAKLINRHGTTSGCEAAFSILPFVRRRKLTDNESNSRVDFVDKMGDKWQNYSIDCNNVLEWKDVTGLESIEDSPWYKSCAPDMNWQTRVEIQSILQKHIDHSISSTINLPNNVTEEEVAKIYLDAYKNKLKGITIYRDGCRSGVLISKEDAAKTSKTTKDATKRPKTLPAEIFHKTIKGQKYIVVIGLLNGTPYEVFAGKHDNIHTSIKKGSILKNKRGDYSILNEESDVVVENICPLLEDVEEALTRMVSTSLRHDVELKYIVEQLEKTRGSLQSFGKVLAKVLTSYVVDGTIVTGNECENCSAQLIRENGCVSCKGCGWSKC